MKHLKIIISSLVVVGVSYMYTSCAKTAPDMISATDTNFSNKATVQIIETAVNATRNYVYIDGSAITGTTIGTGSIYPVSGNGFLVSGGLRSFLIRDTLPTAPSPTAPQVPYTFAENFDAGQHYTIFIYDTVTALKQKTVKDNIVVPTDTTSRLRFANFVYSTVAVPNVDVYSFNRQAVIFSNIPITGVTDFIPYPSRLPLDTLYVRETGTTNVLIKTSTTVLTPKRSYTFVYRGSYKGTKATTLYATY